MQDIPRHGLGQGGDGYPTRLFATFKLATPWVVEIVQKKAVAGQPRIAANINMPGLVPQVPST